MMDIIQSNLADGVATIFDEVVKPIYWTYQPMTKNINLSLLIGEALWIEDSAAQFDKLCIYVIIMAIRDIKLF